MNGTASGYESVISTVYKLGSPLKKEREFSISCIPEFASLLGVERTIHELIPFYVDCKSTAEDEIVLILNNISQISFVNYTAQHMEVLYSSIKQFAELDYDYIRDAFADTVRNLSISVNSKLFKSFLFDNIKKMLEEECKQLQSSSVILFSRVCDHLPRECVKEYLKQLLDLKEGYEHVFTAFLRTFNYIWTTIDKSQRDPCTDVLVAVIKSSNISYMRYLPSVLTHSPVDVSLTLETINNIISSSDFRGKSELVNNIGKIKNIPRMNLERFITRLYRDNNPIIHVMLTKNLHLIDQLGNHVLKTIVDKVIYGNFLAETKLELVKILPKLYISTEYIDKLMQVYIKSDDFRFISAGVEALITCSDSYRMVAIKKNLPHICWRGLYEIAKYHEFVTDEDILAFLLSCDFIRVRERTIESLVDIKNISLPTKVDEVIESLSVSPDYQLRQTAIKLIFDLDLVKKYDKNLSCFLDDKVSNVRYTLAKCLIEKNECQSLLKRLSSDIDEDVQDLFR